MVPVEDLAVLGFSGVVARLPRIWSAYRRLLAEARAFRPHAAVLVDSPGFNFRLGPALRRLGVPVFYYIAPQVWAWHAGARRGQMARWVDRLAVIFPFEEALFRRAGVDARFVGHPLLEGLEPEVDEAALRARGGGRRRAARMLGLLPGSRPQELRAHAPVMAAAARRLRAERPGLGGGAGAGAGARARGRGWIGGALGGVRVLDGPHPGGPGARHLLRGGLGHGDARDRAVRHARGHRLSHRAGSTTRSPGRVVRLARIGLPNIVAGREVAPELLQGDLTAGAAGGGARAVAGRPGAARAGARRACARCARGSVGRAPRRARRRGCGRCGVSGRRAHPWWLPVASAAGAAALRLLGATWRLRRTNTAAVDRRLAGAGAASSPCGTAGCCPASTSYRDLGVAALVSRSRDGELITGVIERIGYVAARGSSTRGGQEGFQELVRFAAAGRSLDDHARRPARARRRWSSRGSCASPAAHRPHGAPGGERLARTRG